MMLARLAVTPQNKSMQTNVRPEVKRVLIYRLGSLGDTVVALPSLHLIARAFPNAERRMLTNFPVNSKAPAAAAILAENGLVQEYFRYVVGTRSPKELLKLWWTLLRWRPQVVVHLGSVRGVKNARRDEQFFRLCGFPEQIGAAVTEGMQKHLFQAEYQALEPESERLARNIAPLGDAQIDKREAWDLRLTDAENAKAAEMLAGANGRPIVAVCVGTKMQAKDWGRENWRELLRRLGGRYPQFALALAGAAEENEASEFAAEGWRESVGAGAPVINLCGRLTPRESAACIARAEAFLGHDSGPMHLAASVGTPCVAVFSARNIPRVWYPHGRQHRVVYHKVKCAGCWLETCIVEKKRCLTSISVDEVELEVRTLLDGHVAGTKTPEWNEEVAVGESST
jgi:heptosyltransferase-3